MNHRPCTGLEHWPSPLTPQYTVSSITVLAGSDRVCHLPLHLQFSALSSAHSGCSRNDC